MEEQKTETDLPRILGVTRKLRKMHPLDVLGIALLTVVVIAVATFLVHRQIVNIEASSAQKISDQVIADIAKQNTTGVRAFGTKQFQTSFDKANLSSQLKNFASVYNGVKPAIDSRVVTNNAQGHYVIVVYRYDLLKLPFFIRVDMAKPTGSSKWYVQGISTAHDNSTDQSTSTPTTTLST